MRFHDLPIGEDAPEIVSAVIEIPTRQRQRI